MGYTIGRHLTKEFVTEQASKYKTLVEFQTKDGSSYQTARRAGYLKEITTHMVPGNFSIPQRTCQQIFDALLNLEGLYNKRSIIKPYELDIYYQEYRLGVEYCGKGWYSINEAKQRDLRKRELCQLKNISLISILERNRHYEEDIKNQIIENLDLLNRICIKKIGNE